MSLKLLNTDRAKQFRRIVSLLITTVFLSTSTIGHTGILSRNLRKESTRKSQAYLEDVMGQSPYDALNSYADAFFMDQEKGLMPEQTSGPGRNPHNPLGDEQLLPNDPAQSSFMGQSVARSGGCILVGAPYGHSIDPNDPPGKVYVFEQIGETWTQTSEIIGDTNEHTTFGRSIALSGDYAIIGSRSRPSGYGGHALIYKKNASGEWDQIYDFTINHWTQRFLGDNVDISENYAIVSDHGKYVSGVPSAGAVYVFSRDGGSWTNTHEILAPDPSAADEFGRSISLSVTGNSVAVASNSGVYIFKRNQQSWDYVTKIIIPIVPGSRFKVDMTDDVVSIGDLVANKVYLYQNVNEEWSLLGEIESPDHAESSDFGFNLSLCDDDLIVGARFGVQFNERLNKYVETGNAYVYYDVFSDLEVDDVLYKIDTSFSSLEWYFGWAVHADEFGFVIGSPGYRHNNLSNAGTAYVYSIDPKPLFEFSNYVINVRQGQTKEATINALDEDLENVVLVGSVPSFVSQVFNLQEKSLTVSASPLASDPSGMYLFEAQAQDQQGNIQTVTVYVFVYPHDWESEQLLPHAIPQNYDRFGMLLSRFEDYLAVYHPGSIFLFRNQAQGWSISQEIKIPVEASAVVLKEGWLFIGLRELDGSYPLPQKHGAVYVYKQVGEQFVFHQELRASNSSAWQYFGHSLDASGDRLVVSSVNSEAIQFSGLLWVFELEDGYWTEKVILSSPDQQEEDAFGFLVDVHEDVIVASAINDDVNGQVGGAIYIFKKDGLAWSQVQKIRAHDYETADCYGYSLGINDEYIFVGAPSKNGPGNLINQGAVYVYQRNALDEWLFYDQLTKYQGFSCLYFGQSISVLEGSVLIGSPGGYSSNNIKTGKAFLFNLENRNWQEVYAFSGEGGNEGEQFGHSVDLSQEGVVIGAVGAQPFPGVLYSGIVYAFEHTNLLAVNDEAETSINTSVSISVLDNDFGDNLSVYSFSQPSNGQAMLDNNQIIYDPNLDWQGVDTFTYHAIDGNGEVSNQAWVTVTVVDTANQAPTADAGGPYTAQANQQGIATITLDGSASIDPDNYPDPLTYSWAWAGGGSATGVNPTVELNVDITSVTLTVSDGQASDIDTATVSIAAYGNQAPTADAGGPYTAQANQQGIATITLDGSASIDPDNYPDPLTYSWAWAGGGSATGVNPTVELNVDITSVTLTVSDGQASDIDTATVSIAAYGNQAPTADAGGPYTAQANQQGIATITLDGSASIDPDNYPDPLTYSWAWAGGGSATGVNPTVELNVDITSVTLTVSDGQASDIDTATVSIAAYGNQAPTADAGGPYTAQANQQGIATITLDGSASIDPDNYPDPLTYSWAWAGGGSATGVNPTVELNVDITSVTLTVSDGQASDIDTATVSIAAYGNQAPTADAGGPYTAQANQQGIATITLDGSASIDPDNYPDPLTYSWAWAGGGSATGVNPTVELNVDITSVTLTVSDGQASDIDTATVSIAAYGNQAPTADAGGPYTAQANQQGIATITLDGSASIDPDNYPDPLTYSWAWAGGGSATGVNPTVELNVDITSVTLTVSDGQASDIDTATVSIAAYGNQAPTADAGGPYTAQANQQGIATITLDGSASIDPDNYPDPLTYSWAWAGGGSATGVNPTVELNVDITSVTLTVSDGQASDIDTATVSIAAYGNQAPTADAGGPYTAQANQQGIATITLDGSASIDPDNYPDPLTYSWAWAGGGSATGVNPTVELNVDITSVTLTVSDGQASDIDTATVSIAAYGNQAPTADAGGPYTAQANQQGIATITLDGSASIDPDNYPDPLTYSWAWAGGGSATGVNPTVELNVDITSVTLTVSDGQASDIDTATVSIAAYGNQAPTADAGGPYTAQANQQGIATITLDGSASIDPDNYPDPLTYSWAWAGGGNATGVNPTVELNVDITSVTLTVSDGQASDIDTATVSIAAYGNQPPVFNPQNYTATLLDTVNVGTEILTVTAVDDNIPGPIQYSIYNGGQGYFGINSSSGLLTTIQPLQEGVYNLEIDAFDGELSALQKANVVIIVEHEQNYPNQQVIHLKAGWNYFAPTVQAPSMQVEDLLAPLVAANNLVFAHRSVGGKVFWPSQNINTITAPLSPSVGVKIKLNTPQTLVISGNPIAGSGDISLNKGTHYVGFLNDKEAMLTVQALIDQDALTIVYDSHDDTYIGKVSGSWVNTIGTFQKGRAYMFVVKKACVLNIK